MKSFTCTANHVDILAGRIRPSVLTVTQGRVQSIEPLGKKADPSLPYMLPGFIDAHVHIESSMLVPSEFARLAVVHGTVATVSDPHEIANVLGEAGVLFMLDNAATVPFRFFFGAPSCVPATAFETAGSRLDATAVRRLLQRPDILYLSEMMNFPGVLNGDREVREKIAAALSLGKPVDGHAPGLRGEQARRYAGGGEDGRLVISTDHECFTRAEALDKLNAGMHILIREGSAARNFAALAALVAEYPDRTMFCSDDKHPDSLVEGHINVLVRRAVKQGLPLFSVLRAACVNPVLHYRLPSGLLRPGDPADFIVVEDLAGFAVRQTYVGGAMVAEKGSTLIAPVAVTPVNHFHCTEKTPEDFAVAAEGVPPEIEVIGALDGELITEKTRQAPRVEQGRIVADPANDLLKIAVVNRYHPAPPAVAFVRGFGLKEGAIASSVAHDSHNIIAVGAGDEALARAVNLVVRHQGGISAVSAASEKVLALPVAGLMSADDGYRVAAAYSELDGQAKKMGSRLRSPFMTLSFMALLVIPHLKLSDLGLFDGDRFTFTPLVPPLA